MKDDEVMKDSFDRERGARLLRELAQLVSSFSPEQRRAITSALRQAIEDAEEPTYAA